jgi:hypothetical protein
VTEQARSFIDSNLSHANATADRDSGPNSTRRTSGKVWVAGLFVAIAFQFVFFSADFTRPWTQDDYYNGAVWSHAAHNLLRAGIRATAGVPVSFYFAPPPFPPSAYYVHHPSLLPITLAGIFSLFGESEWAARLVPILCSICSTALLWLLVRGCAGERAATFSALLLAGMPMELHYGQMVNFEPCALMLMLAALLSLRFWIVTKKKRWGASFFLSLLLAMWTAWLGYFLALILAVDFARRRKAKLAVSLFALAIVSGILFLLQIHSVRPDAWTDLANAFQLRASASNGNGAHFNLIEWLREVGGSLAILIFPISWLLAAVGAFYAFRQRHLSELLRWIGWAALLLFLLDAIYIVAFPNASFIHDYAGFYFIAPVAMMGGIALDALANRMDRRGIRHVGTAAALCLILLVALFGRARARSLQSQAYLLDGQTYESAQFIPKVGTLIRAHFPENAQVLCNFEPYGTTLPFYAQRVLLPDITDPADWQRIISGSSAPAGGIIWMGSPGAENLLARAPTQNREFVEIEGARFYLWLSGARRE